MNKDQILERLDKTAFYQELLPSLKINGKPEALGLCPFHDDHTPSLSVNTETGLYFCPVCNDGGDILKFYMRLKQVNFKDALNQLAGYSGQSGEKATSKIEAVYPYTDEAGNVLFEVVRYIPKTFRQRRPDGKGGYIYNLDGVRIVPYNLPRVIASDTVYICEGEKDCDALAKIDLVATTNPMGAGKWREEFGQYFTDKDIIIICDNDEAGKKHGRDVGQKLGKHTKSIKVIESLPGVPHKGDVSDWLKLPGNTKDKLLEIVRDAPQWTPSDQLSSFTPPLYTRKAGKLEISTIKDVLKYERPAYLVEPFLYKNTSNLLTAYAGVGKSLVAMSIVRSVITGLPLWDTFPVHHVGGVLIVDEENPGAFLRDRLVKMGFKEDMPLHFLHYQSIKLDNPQCFSELLEIIQQVKPILVVFDALIRLHDAKENDNSEMAYVMGRIRDLINQTGVTALTIHHDKKGGAGGDRKERARGGSDIVGAIDSQICVEAKAEDETLVLSPGKCRMMPFKPIKLKIDNTGDRLSFAYIGKELSEAEELTAEIIEVMGKTCMGIEDIKQGLEAKGYEVGLHKLRNILKLSTGKEILTERGMHGRLMYRVAFQLSGDAQTARKAETLDNKGAEGRFPVLQHIYRPESWKAENGQNVPDEPINLDALEVE